MGYEFKCKISNNKTFRKYIGEDLQDLALDKEFLDLTQKARCRAEGMAQAEEYLPIKHKALNSTLVPPEKQIKKHCP
jgi:hypothetical protein